MSSRTATRRAVWRAASATAALATISFAALVLASPAAARPQIVASHAPLQRLETSWVNAGGTSSLPAAALARARRELARHVPHIVGGQPAEPGFWQSTVGIEFALNDGTFSFCTGSIFGSRWVVTAAHCVENSYGAVVGFGSYNIDDPNIGLVGVELAATFADPRDDVALLRLHEAVTQPGIRLQRTEEADLASPGQNARIAGWGLTSTNAPDISHTLLEATVPIVDPLGCAKYYGLDFNLFTMLCVGGNGVGACHGDSGGPLVPVAEGRPVLAGVDSYGPITGCATNGTPEVYMSVAAYTQDLVNYAQQDDVAPVGLPTASASGASEIAPNSALISGVVDAHGLATDFQIAYAPGTSLPGRSGGSHTSTPLLTATQYAGEAGASNVQLQLTGLRAGTTYAYQLVAINAAGQVSSTTATFKTARDTHAPVVRAVASGGKAGTRVALKYRAQDDFSTTTHERVRVYDGKTVIATITGRPTAKQQGVVYHLDWKAPAGRTGGFKFCVESTDESGNRSAPSCAAVRLT